jgi:hypothetical protein
MFDEFSGYVGFLLKCSGESVQYTERMYRCSRHHVAMSVTAQHIERSNFRNAYRVFTWYSTIILRNTRIHRRRDGPFWQSVSMPHFLAGHFDHHQRDLIQNQRSIRSHQLLYLWLSLLNGILKVLTA